MNIGDKIKEQRLKKGWTQEQLGQLLNVSRPTISSWEVGRNYPDLETIIAISDLFGISLDHLLREDKEMAKDTTKKIKNGRIYKYVLIGLAVILIPYSAFHLKLRYDEHTYRTNLDQRHWVQLSDTDSPDSDGNAYELIENTIHYWTYVLPTGWVGFPLDEQKLSIVTNKEDFFITIDHDGKIGVSISPENDANFNKQVYVNTNKQGELIEPKASWSTKYKENILEYLKKYQDIHAELITRSIEKLDEVAG